MFALQDVNPEGSHERFSKLRDFSGVSLGSVVGQDDVSGTEPDPAVTRVRCNIWFDDHVRLCQSNEAVRRTCRREMVKFSRALVAMRDL